MKHCIDSYILTIFKISSRLQGMKYQVDIFDGTSESAANLSEKFYSSKSPKLVESTLIRLSHFFTDSIAK